MSWTNIALLFTFSVLVAYGYLHWDEIKQDTNFISQTFTGLFTLIGNYFFGDNEPRGGDDGPRGNEPGVQQPPRRNNGYRFAPLDYYNTIQVPTNIDIQDIRGETINNNVVDDNRGEGPSNVNKLPDQPISKGKEKDDKKPFEPIRGIFSS